MDRGYSLRSLREREIASLVAACATNKEIARYLSISEKTVKNTRTKVFAKTGMRTRTELAVHLVRLQLVQ